MVRVSSASSQSPPRKCNQCAFLEIALQIANPNQALNRPVVNLGPCQRLGPVWGSGFFVVRLKPRVAHRSSRFHVLRGVFGATSRYNKSAEVIVQAQKPKRQVTVRCKGSGFFLSKVGQE